MFHMSAADLAVVPPTPAPGKDVAGKDLAGIDPPRLGTPTGAIQFSETVRCLVALSRCGGLAVPVFTSPPRRVGVDRTIRRRGDKPPVVAITRVGRPLAAVQSDVIEAVVVVNDLDDHRADRFRRAAWGELERAGLTPCHLVDQNPVDSVARGSGVGRAARVAS